MIYLISIRRRRNQVTVVDCVEPTRGISSGLISHEINAHERLPKEGFALVLALSLMAFVLLLLLSLTTLVRVETQSSSAALQRLAAEQAAQLGLMVALGELQKTAGQDVRVTATAELFNGSDNVYTGNLSPVEGQEQWVGVWRSSTVPVPGTGREYDPAQPNTRSFSQWLVSAANADGTGRRLSSLDDVGNAVASEPESIVLARRGDGTPRLRAGKVKAALGDGGLSSYAYAVQDEGVKADVGWNERSPDAVSAERYQAMRIAASAGPDYGALFSSDSETFDPGAYPLSRFDRAAGQDGLFRINTLSSSLPAVVTQDPGFLPVNGGNDWLRDQLDHFTAQSVGVLTDVKKGGLRRDLSLAFEMDGTADTTLNEQPVKFNQQVGEFVGGDDRMAAPVIGRGMPVEARHLYRDLGGLPELEQSPFSADIPSGATGQNRTQSVLRGPTWWALRDYANLYKRLRANGSEFELDARAYYPNWSAIPPGEMWGDVFSLAGMMSHGDAGGGQSNKGGAWDQEESVRTIGKDWLSYLYMPARATYAPVILGGACAYSVLVQNERTDPSNPKVTIGDLSLGMDPFFYLWNPYNRRLTMDRYAIMVTNGFTGHITLWKNHGTSSEEQFGPRSMRDYLIATEVEDQGERSEVTAMTYLVKDLSLAPGEVLIVSPKNTTSGSRLRDEASPGIQINATSGIITEWIPEATLDNGGNATGNITGRIQTVVTASTDPAISVDEISYLFSQDYVNVLYNVGSFDLNAMLPDSDADLDFFDDRPSPYMVGKLGNHLQTTGGKVTQDSTSQNYQARGLFVPDITRAGIRPTIAPVGSIGADQLGSGLAKEFFGFYSYLAKPSSSPAARAQPVEILAQFNPAAPANGLETQRGSNLNYAIQSICEPNGIGQHLQTAGVDLPVGDRGYWGATYDSNGGMGQTSVPIKSIPTGPLLSLVEFRNANLGHRSSEPFRPVANSFASIFNKPESPYGPVPGIDSRWGTVMASDVSWLLNESLFDRYFLSGLAGDFEIQGAGYAPQGSLSDTVARFYGDDFRSANANPLIRPYIPEGKNSTDIVNELAADDGYKRFGAYALIDGAFNVNSTSVRAWEALLRSNRNLPVGYADGGGDSDPGTPFPPYVEPSSLADGRGLDWAGLARLDDDEVRRLAEAIVDQVKLRGPFMSLSDFVNRRVGEPVDSRTHFAGAIQAAIDAANLNSKVQGRAGGVSPTYGGDYAGFFEQETTNNIGARRTTTGIAADLTQADVLLPLAPRLSARSDTFTIRAYGEVQSPVSGDVVTAYCEATIQRLPEYVNDSDDPWAESGNPFAPSAVSNLDSINVDFGRRFIVVGFRWLDSDEI